MLHLLPPDVASPLACAKYINTTSDRRAVEALQRGCWTLGAELLAPNKRLPARRRARLRQIHQHDVGSPRGRCSLEAMQQSASAALAAEAKRRKKREKRAARPEAAGWTLGDVLGWAAANGAGEPEVLDRLEQQAIDGAALAALREPEFHELLRDLPDYHGALRLLGPRKRLWLSVRALQKPPEPAPAGLAGLSADDLGGWLRDAGLGEHARRFAQSDIDGDVLAALTEAELRELGVKVGLRKALRRRLCELSAGCVADAPAAASEWSVEQVGWWLDDTGAGRWRGHFQRHAVDGSALLSLDDVDVQEIGVAQLGARKAIVRRLKSLRRDDG